MSVSVWPAEHQVSLPLLPGGPPHPPALSLFLGAPGLSLPLSAYPESLPSASLPALQAEVEGAEPRPQSQAEDFPGLDLGSRVFLRAHCLLPREGEEGGREPTNPIIIIVSPAALLFTFLLRYLDWN